MFRDCVPSLSFIVMTRKRGYAPARSRTLQGDFSFTGWRES